MKERKYKVITITMEKSYLIEMHDGIYSCINGWTLGEIIEDWFEKYNLDNYHASREGSEFGGTKRFIKARVENLDNFRKYMVICPYCKKRALLVDSAEIYGGRSFGPVYLCKCLPRFAYVGCHRGTDTPLGTLADYDLREARKRAHKVFDPLWKQDLLWKQNGESRTAVYKWLSKMLGILEKDCHIAMFDMDQCIEVIAICRRRRNGE